MALFTKEPSVSNLSDHVASTYGSDAIPIANDSPTEQSAMAAVAEKAMMSP
jgi:hypothetical protein